MVIALLICIFVTATDGSMSTCDASDPLKCISTAEEPSTLQSMSKKIAVWQGKPANSIEGSLNLLEKLLAEVAAEGASILVLPELFIGGYETEKPATRAIHADGSEIQRAAHAAKTNGVAVVFGFAEHPAKADESEMRKREVAQAAQATDSALAPAVFNSAVAIGEDGVVRYVYHKTHLFGVDEKRAFIAGEKLSDVFELAGLRVGLLICYDVEFPETVREVASKGAEVVLVPTANFEPYNWVNDMMVPVRAMENHVHMVYANWAEFRSAAGVPFNGRSRIAGPRGEVVMSFGEGESGLKVATLVEKEGNATSYEDDYLQDLRPNLYTVYMQ